MEQRRCLQFILDHDLAGYLDVQLATLRRSYAVDAQYTNFLRAVRNQFEQVTLMVTLRRSLNAKHSKFVEAIPTNVKLHMGDAEHSHAT
jgi:hypothetical protein